MKLYGNICCRMMAKAHGIPTITTYTIFIEEKIYLKKIVLLVK